MARYWISEKVFFWKCFERSVVGGICFAVAFAVELTIFAAQGHPAHLEFYITGFSLTGSQGKNTEFVFFILCILLNVINVWMEEGIFRGLFIKLLSGTKTFMKANLTAGILFGLWHLVMPIKSYINGEMTFSAMLFMSIGYMILSGMMGLKWGLLYRITGNVWMGLGDHLLNNTIGTNMLHVVSGNGADELQIVRIMLAQMISFIFVWVIYRHKKQRNTFAF